MDGGVVWDSICLTTEVHSFAGVSRDVHWEVVGRITYSAKLAKLDANGSRNALSCSLPTDYVSTRVFLFVQENWVIELAASLAWHSTCNCPWYAYILRSFRDDLHLLMTMVHCMRAWPTRSDSSLALDRNVWMVHLKVSLHGRHRSDIKFPCRKQASKLRHARRTKLVASKREKVPNDWAHGWKKPMIHLGRWIASECHHPTFLMQNSSLTCHRICQPSTQKSIWVIPLMWFFPFCLPVTGC